MGLIAGFMIGAFVTGLAMGATASVVKPDDASYVVNQPLSVPLHAGDAIQWSFFETSAGDLSWADCRKAAAEPDTAPAQIARARQIVTSRP